MDWITGLQRAIDYVEANLTGEIDYGIAARESLSSPYHFQRVFSILSGMTLGEYIRARRLTLAGAELASGDVKVIDVALKYGYDSPDSFARAFRRFHGITPAEAKQGAGLKAFSRLSVRILLEGGTIMDYRLEQKPALTLLGYRRFFRGSPGDRAGQESEFFINTRAEQDRLNGMAGDCVTQWTVITGFRDDGYDFWIAAQVPGTITDDPAGTPGQADAARFEVLNIPAQLYMVCQTPRCAYPTLEQEALRRQAISEWLPSSGFELADAPEINVSHWFCKPGDEAVRNSRYIELWLPVTPTKTTL